MSFLKSLGRYLGIEPVPGASPENAVVVNSVAAEYRWLEQHFPDWQIGVQSCRDIDDRSFDVITLRRDTEERTVYFDITSFVGPTEPAEAAGNGALPVTASSTRPAQTMFPLQDAHDFLAKCRPGVERDGLTLRWPDHDGITALRVEPIEHRTHDGLVVRELVTVTHTAPHLATTPRIAAMLNRWSTLSALLPGTADNAQGRLVCKVGIFDGDDAAATQLYAPLVCSEAALIGWHAARLVRDPRDIDPDRSPLTMVRDPSPYDAADFEAAKAFTDRLPALGTLGGAGFTVEFPWDDGAVSRMFALPDLRQRPLEGGDHSETELDRMAGRTSLLQIVTSEPHSLYGNGVLVRLELPVPFDGDSGPALVDELNRWERSGVDLPPLFGAWCLGKRAPTFVSFIPNQFCVGLPGLLQNLAVWAHGRHVRVRQWLEASHTRN